MGLRRGDDAAPGIRRQQTRRGVRYRRQDGRPMSLLEKRRVRALAVPPAWRDVWISADPEAHIQATGLDAAGRKQYIYHDAWRRMRDGAKFRRMEAFGEALPRLRRTVAADLARPGLPREKVLAAVVRVLEQCFLRVGSERYARENRSYGATTLRRRHAEVDGEQVRLCFRGKGGKRMEANIDDPGVVQVIRRCRRIRGQRLFSYERDGQRHRVGSGAVNQYLRRATGGRFTSKDVRTWAASVLMLHLILEAGPRPEHGTRMAVLRREVAEVARRMQHTPAVCRRSYVHPLVPAAYMDGSLEARVASPPAAPELWPEERRFVALLASYRD